MSNDSSQATPVDQVNLQGVQDQGLATQQVSTPPADPQTEVKPLTREEVQEIVTREATRIAQSQVAKGENRIQKVITERISALTQTKDILGLTDQQFNEAKQKIVTEAYTTPEPQEEAPTSASSATPDVDRAIQFMNTQVDAVFAEVGTSVVEGDVEMKEFQDIIEKSWNDPNGLTKITLGAQRLALKKQARLQALNETAGARTLMGGGNSQGAPVLSPEEKISQGLKTSKWDNGGPRT